MVTVKPLRLDAVIERRLLLNYRVEPDVVARLLPAPFRPRVRHGHAVVGVCLIRLGRTRPAGLPAWSAVGVGSENAAHRFAVEWDAPGGRRTGVYIARRDTGSRVNVVAGGRLFPGVHRADFDVAEQDDRLRIAYQATDGRTAVDVEVRVAPDLRDSVLFDDAEAASDFFRGAAVGFSADREPRRFRALQLVPSRWTAAPCVVDRAACSFYDDRAVFPAGVIHLDSALVMRQVPARWTALEPLSA